MQKKGILSTDGLLSRCHGWQGATLCLVLITITIQLAVYILFDWQAGQLINPVIKTDKAYAIKTDLSSAGNFALSYNKKYLACLDAEQLKIIDLTSHKMIFTTGSTSQDLLSSVLTADSVLGFRWLPDRNSLVYLAESDPQIGMVSLYSLDLSVVGAGNLNTEGTSDSSDTADFDSSYTSDLSGESVAASTKSSGRVQPKLDREIGMDVQRILQIEISTYTNNLFILYEDSNQDTRLMKIDIMKTVNTISLPGEMISKLAVSNKYGIAYLESELENKKVITAITGGTRKVLSQTAGDILLGCQDTEVYIGTLKGNATGNQNGILSEIDSYHVQVDSSAVTKTNLWQGETSYNAAQSVVSSNGMLAILSNEELIVISAKGAIRSVKITSGTSGKSHTVNVLSPTNDLYLELWPGEKKSVYYWRKIGIN